MIATSVYNAARWLPRHLQQINALDYPQEAITYCYITARNDDNSEDILYQFLRDKPYYKLLKQTLPQSWSARRRMWEAGRVKLLHLDDEDYVFMCDCDVTMIPPETLRTLMALDVDMVHPYIYVDPEDVPENPWRGERRFYDTWAFRFHGVPWRNKIEQAEEARALADDRGLIYMDAVGANPLLIKSDVLAEVMYRGDLAILGFCSQARKLGFEIYAYPALECLHSWEAID